MLTQRMTGYWIDYCCYSHPCSDRSFLLNPDRAARMCRYSNYDKTPELLRNPEGLNCGLVMPNEFDTAKPNGPDSSNGRR